MSENKAGCPHCAPFIFKANKARKSRCKRTISRPFKQKHLKPEKQPLQLHAAKSTSKCPYVSKTAKTTKTSNKKFKTHRKTRNIPSLTTHTHNIRSFILCYNKENKKKKYNPCTLINSKTRKATHKPGSNAISAKNNKSVIFTTKQRHFPPLPTSFTGVAKVQKTSQKRPKLTTTQQHTLPGVNPSSPLRENSVGAARLLPKLPSRNPRLPLAPH